MKKKIYTAESVTSGHPDKLCDLIADSILDACLEKDANSRVACEVMLAHDKCFIAGEITTAATVNYIDIAKATIAAVGYDPLRLTYEYRLRPQSPDISQAVERQAHGAGDQGVMFGYATDETLNYMPLCAELAHRLTARLEVCRRSGEIEGLLPDGKAQVSVEYADGRFSRIASVVLSAQHEEWKSVPALRSELMRKVVAPVFTEFDLTAADVLINPSGRFVLGGFEADAGLTGRKIIVDSYGGAAHHGGGAFSGKDASKVDRSGAYMARYVAKNIVAAGLAEKCEVMLSYAIGKAEPTAVDVDTFGTGAANDVRIAEAVRNVFDLTPGGIIARLGLKRPIFAATVVGGHFGKEGFPWEKTDRTEELKRAVLS